MDITNTNTNTTVKTPEAESETPTRIQPQPVTTKTPPFINGVLKRHPPLNLHHQYNHHPPHHPPVVLAYRECLKNHAATLGGHALDGCGEFMPSSASIPADPTSLKCAACGCHRNFHRREPDDTLNHQLITTAAPALDFLPHHRHHPPPPRGGNGNNSNSSPNNSSSPSPPPISSAYYPASAPHMLLALSHPAPQSEGNNHHSPVPNFSRKRFRTKFTQNQKEKMLEFADKVGWKMLKKDEDSIGEFCAEIGVDKGVFKVWMHNNKNTFGKKDLIFTAEGGGSGGVLAIATPPAVVAGSSNGGGYNEVSDERKEMAVDSGNNRGDEKENAGGSSSRSSS